QGPRQAVAPPRARGGHGRRGPAGLVRGAAGRRGGRRGAGRLSGRTRGGDGAACGGGALGGRRGGLRGRRGRQRPRRRLPARLLLRRRGLRPGRCRVAGGPALRHRHRGRVRRRGRDASGVPRRRVRRGAGEDLGGGRGQPDVPGAHVGDRAPVERAPGRRAGRRLARRLRPRRGGVERAGRRGTEHCPGGDFCGGASPGVPGGRSVAGGCRGPLPVRPRAPGLLQAAGVGGLSPAAVERPLAALQAPALAGGHRAHGVRIGVRSAPEWAKASAGGTAAAATTLLLALAVRAVERVEDGKSVHLATP
ncbi:unnamed protein product, partial [Prorocentrum cordatum]